MKNLFFCLSNEIKFQLSILLLIFFLAAWPAHSQNWRQARYLMGTIAEIDIHGENALLERAAMLAFDEIARLESVMSSWRQDSEISLLNARAPKAAADLSDDLFEVLDLSQRWARKTGGAFDVTVGPLLKVWGVNLQEPGYPTLDEVNKSIQSVGYRYLKLDQKRHRASFKKSGMAIDLGGIGKGFALDKAARLLIQEGASGGRINFGGQILVFGQPERGHNWEILIASPRDQQRMTARFFLPAGWSASTSSQGSRTIGHIIDPRTSRPVDWMGSVTVVAPSAAVADAISTALLVLGPKEGLAWVKKHPPIKAFFINSKSEILASEGWEELGLEPVGGARFSSLHEQIWGLKQQLKEKS